MDFYLPIAENREAVIRNATLALTFFKKLELQLGHASVQTTEQYLGCKQKLNQAVNDNVGLEDI